MSRIVSLVLLLVAALGVLLGILIWGAKDREEPLAAAVPPVASPDGAGASSARLADPIAPGSSHGGEMPARASVAVEEPENGSKRTSACIVRGRVVDEEGAPLAGVAVRLAAYKLWAEGVDVPRLEGQYDMRGFEVATDASGSFRLETPPPTAPRVTLSIVPDRFHDSYSVIIGSTQRGALPALVAGERDLGEIRLATTGALTGRVTDENGGPLADVKITIGPDRVATSGRDAWTRPGGDYVVAHAPVGTYAIRAKLDGYLVQYVEPVTVEAGRDTGGIDFVLAAAPTISGFVIDEHGRPLEGARLWGWPKGHSGHGAGATSGADGRFAVFLPQDEPYTLGAKLDGHLTWGNEHDHSVTYAPGTAGLEIVLRSLARTRFRVVDRETGSPIEHFGLNILADNGHRSPNRVYTEHQPPSPSHHPGGVAEATARVGIDLYVVAAEGYELATGEIEHESAGEPAQTVRMRRGATVRGRVLRDGTGQPGVPVELARIRSYARIVNGVAASWDRYSVDFNTTRAVRTDAEGRFALTGVSKGEHRLRIRPTRGAPLILAPVKVEGRRALDLGDLLLLPGAAIDGQVLLPSGVEPAGLQVDLDDPLEGVSAVCDGAGRFRFENVPPGVHFLGHGDRPGEMESGEPVRVDLASGETREVILDARDRSMCAVALNLELGDVPAAGCRVELRHPGDGRGRAELGICDEAGVVHGSARAWGEARVVVHLGLFREVEHPDVRLRLEPLGRIQAKVRFDFAGLTLRLPRGVDLPEQGYARLQLEPVDAERPTQEVFFPFGERALLLGSQFQGGRAGELWVKGLIAGRHRMTLDLVDAATEPVAASMMDCYSTPVRPPYYSGTRDLSLAAGDTLVLDL